MGWLMEDHRCILFTDTNHFGKVAPRKWVQIKKKKSWQIEEISWFNLRSLPLHRHIMNCCTANVTTSTRLTVQKSSLRRECIETSVWHHVVFRNVVLQCEWKSVSQLCDRIFPLHTSQVVCLTLRQHLKKNFDLLDNGRKKNHLWSRKHDVI